MMQGVIGIYLPPSFEKNLFIKYKLRVKGIGTYLPSMEKTNMYDFIVKGNYMSISLCGKLKCKVWRDGRKYCVYYDSNLKYGIRAVGSSLPCMT